MTAYASVAAFEAALADLPVADDAAIAAAAARQAQLTKPAGSLGRLEEVALFLAGWQGRERPRIERSRMAVFAGNHGVAVHGVSAFPTSVTAQMVANFRAGGAAINALSGAAGMELTVDAIDLDTPTADFTREPAMTEAECLAALNVGAAQVEDRPDLLAIGEMGIANSTAASALCARSLGGNAFDWVGAGSGVEAEGIAGKVEVVDRALQLHANAGMSAFETLRRVGGREIVAMAGAVLRARQLRVPVMLDGFISGSAVAPLFRDNPAITVHCLAGHCSAERGHARLLAAMRLTPLLKLGMRLGEGSGAAVAVSVVRSALAAHNEMATFAEAQVSASL